MCLKKLKLWFVTIFIIGGLSLSACTLTQGEVLPTETSMVTTTVIQQPQPTATEVTQVATVALPTAELTVIPTATVVVIEQKTLMDEGEDPKYTVELNYPFIAGMEAFNQASQAIAERIADAFLENLATNPPVGELSQMSFSSVSMDYSVLEETPEVISVYFQISEYYSGAAHPLPFSEVLNYDLRNQKVLALSDLFQPGADYLQLLSDYAIDALADKEGYSFPEGAAPKAENYQIWNLTPDGLQITFDPYQVGPYAAGFITVEVPFDVLMGIANPNRVLSNRP